MSRNEFRTVFLAGVLLGAWAGVGIMLAFEVIAAVLP